MAGATWKLIIEDDAGKQIVVPFTRDVITIGRKEGNTIRLTERNVSRNHARLSKENGHILIEDLKSFNGIKLNGDRIDGRVHVHEGDTIQIGDYHLALHALDAGAGAGHGNGNGGGVNATQPLRRDNVPPGNDDDEFAGDTQRWEPPAGGLQLSVQGLATQEDRALSDEHTVPQPATGAHGAGAPPPPPPLPPPHGQMNGGFADKNGFGADSGDTERVTMDMLESMNRPPSGTGGALPSRRLDAELEPTVRQTASPPPITMPPSSPAGAAGGAAAMPSPSSPAPAAQGGSQPFPPSPSPAGASSSSAAAALAAQETMPHPAPAPSSPPAPLPAPRPQPSSAAAAPQPAARPPSSPAAPGQAMPPPTIAPRTSKEEAKTVLEEQTEAMRASPGAEDVMYPRLVVLNTIFAGSTFSLRAVEAVMGRTEDNDITIEHKSVSRNHAKIVREGDRVRILDLKSANGVLVNNEEVEAAVLKPGDVVELGRVKLRYVPIGERFAVSPEEIERARIADAAGDDFEADAGTGVTNPVRKKQASGPSPSAPYDLPPTGGGRNTLFFGVGAIILILVVLAVVIGLATSGGDKKTDAADKPDGTAVARVDAPVPESAVKLDPSLPEEKVPTAVPPPSGAADGADAAAGAAAGDPAEKAAPDAAPPGDDDAAEGKPDAAADVKPDAAAARVDGKGREERPRRSSSASKAQEMERALKSAKQKILTGRPEDAVSELKEYNRSDNAEVHRTLGVAYAKLKNNEQARKHYKRYLELNPKAPDAQQVRDILDNSK